MFLNQSPLPSWATRAHLELILAAGVEPATKQFLKLLPVPVWLREQTKFGGSEGIQTLTRSVQDFYAVSYITNPVKESTDGESRTRKNWFLRPVPLPLGYVGVKNIEAGSRNRTDALTDLQSAALNLLGYAREKIGARDGI